MSEMTKHKAKKDNSAWFSDDWRMTEEGFGYISYHPPFDNGPSWVSIHSRVSGSRPNMGTMSLLDTDIYIVDHFCLSGNGIDGTDIEFRTHGFLFFYSRKRIGGR